MIYRSYQHVERLGTTETNGNLDGTCTIFPKIDGTNATPRRKPQARTLA